MYQKINALTRSRCRIRAARWALKADSTGKLTVLCLTRLQTGCRKPMIGSPADLSGSVMLFRMPCDIDADEMDCKKIAVLIQQNISEITDALAGDLRWYSENARLVPGSLHVVSVEYLTANSFKLFYQFEWNLFNACLDLNDTVTQSEQVNFRILPGILEFDILDNTQPSPGDEL